MAFDKVIDSAKLDADLTTVAEAIREKIGTSGKLAFPNGMADAVRNISSGVELPELSNPAEASDIVKGKTLYDDEGNPVTGTIENGNRYVYSYNGGVTAEYEDGAMSFNHTFTEDSLYRAGDVIQLLHSDLGDATAKDVVKGKTFTTTENLKNEGTIKECNDVYNTPGQTATMEWDDDWKASNVLEEDVLLRKGTTVNIWFGRDFFGNATPEDVKKGKTFTSGYGICVEGTMEPSSGGVGVSIDGETLVFSGAATIENDTLIL